VGKPHEAGVTIMLIDEEVDHGPIVAQEKIMIENWPPKGSELEETLGVLGGKLLVTTIPEWIAGNITAQAQEDDKASYMKKITKQSGHIDLSDDPVRMYRKIRAFDIWPRTYFLFKRKGSLHPGRESADSEVRIIVTEAHMEGDSLIIDRVIPEGRREMSYDEFLRGQK
jgi:methionyl-tRNA formyltransferase